MTHSFRTLSRITSHAILIASFCIVLPFEVEKELFVFVPPLKGTTVHVFNGIIIERRPFLQRMVLTTDAHGQVGTDGGSPRRQIDIEQWLFAAMTCPFEFVAVSQVTAMCTMSTSFKIGTMDAVWAVIAFIAMAASTTILTPSTVVTVEAVLAVDAVVAVFTVY